VLELAGAAGLLFDATRTLAAYCLIALFIAEKPLAGESPASPDLQHADSALVGHAIRLPVGRFHRL
jgi:uncharacterized membrane protein